MKTEIIRELSETKETNKVTTTMLGKKSKGAPSEKDIT